MKTPKSSLLVKMSRQPLKYVLITLIILLTLVKLNLIGKGFLAFADESAHAVSGNALKNLSQFKIQDAIGSIFSVPGRPAEVFLKIIPNAVQFVTGYLNNINFYESDNSYPLFLYNFIVYCLLLIVHYKFSKFVLKDDFPALVSVLLFSTLTNSYIYLRHSLPYDASLLIFYTVIYNVVAHKNDTVSVKSSIIAGACAFAGFLVYPGYFPLYLFALTIFFFNNITFNNISQKISRSVYFASGSFLCLIVTEGISRLGNRSFIGDSKNLSVTITQGSFEESFVFISKYLSEVEGISGIILIISLILFFIILGLQIINPRSQQNRLIILLGISLTLLFLIYASAGYFFHKMVFYGRLLHQYFPFICLFSVFAFTQIFRNARINQILLYGLSVVFVLNFISKFQDYQTYSYPRDVCWDATKTVNMKDIDIKCEYEGGFTVSPKLENKIDRVAPDSTPDIPEVIVVNSCLLTPVDDISKYKEYNPQKDYTLITSTPNFFNFKAYQYEGYSIEERAVLDSLKLQLKVFRRQR